jgi:starch synthase (maltosyl-transferring)
MSHYLRKIVNSVRKAGTHSPALMNFAIPDLWVSDSLKTPHIKVHDGHVLVNPYTFTAELIENVFLSQPDQDLKPYFLSHDIEKKFSKGNWIKKSSVYSMMVRSSGSFDHDRTGQLEDVNLDGLKDTGTFIKALAYLPTLKRMGIDVLYLLPIAKYSLKDKKGELGSPYGVSNFYALDDGLKDPLSPDTTVEEEFKAFVEAAHLLDMKVIIDIIPRTNSVNSDMILDHPDWFYWIDLDDLDGYKPPMAETIKSTAPAKVEYFKDLFASPEVEEHLHKFRKNPKDLDPKKWAKLVKAFDPEKQAILDAVRESFGMTIAPAFSDHINDPQPAWSDVTYFRLYLDHPLNSQPYLKKLGNFEPYILFDVAKSSYNPGAKPNTELWNMLSGIIPFYQTEYGIDGARIDMGHALPAELVAMIIDKARAIDPNFCFIAEELDPANAKDAIDKGYNMIIGNGFIMEPRIADGNFNEFVYTARDLPSTVFACGETHDTPRLANRAGKEVLAKMLSVFNLFIPNTVPFLNSGQEVYEKQPMNTGLDCTPEELFALEPTDPFYQKLALFDRYAFHYLHPKRWEMVELLEKANAIRQSILSDMVNLKKAHYLGFGAPWDTAAGIAYEGKNRITLIVANTDTVNDKTHHIRLSTLPDAFKGEDKVIRQLFSSENSAQDPVFMDYTSNIWLPFKKGEVKILEIRLPK